MDIRKLAEKAKDPRFIAGIHNYCDRRCRRCAFTSRCLNFTAGKEDRSDSIDGVLSSGVAVDDLMTTFRGLHGTIRELAEEHGIVVTEAELEAVDREERRRERESERHPLVVQALEYCRLTDAWFEAESDLFPGEVYVSAAERSADGSGRGGDGLGGVEDAVEEIRWYQSQVYVKLRRALDAAMFELDHGDDGFPRDSDGSAKVALLAVDCSIEAWERLRTHYPDKTDRILDPLLELDRLRRAVELAFPGARDFIRPGFDTGEPTVWEEAVR